jgi:hypothetical protein
MNKFLIFFILEETEEKMRKASMIAAELSAINEKKQMSTTLSKETEDLYAEVDFALKRRQRLERERQQNNHNMCSLRKSYSNPDCAMNELSVNYDFNCHSHTQQSSHPNNSYIPRRAIPQIYPRNQYSIVSNSPNNDNSYNTHVYSIS